jgi:FkbM family methyltransferase
MVNDYTSYLDSIGSSKWWLREVKGARIFDKFVLGLLKIVYLGVRFSLRAILGRKTRDKLIDDTYTISAYSEKFAKRKINFRDFLYKSSRILGIEKILLLEISVPTHNYRIHCPLNKEDFIVMTRHEEKIIELFHPKEGDIVVDVGAHMGRYTITSSKYVGPQGKVIAVEAHPYNFKMLQRNISLNGLTNVIAIKCALYSKKARLKLYLPDEELGYTMHHSLMTNYLVAKYSEKIEQKYIEVEAYTLDSLLQFNGIDQVNWIKIDVEGAEYEVLRGAKEILSANKRISILVEVHGKDTYGPTIELLRSNNFNIEFEKTYDNGEKHVLARKVPNL